MRILLCLFLLLAGCDRSSVGNESNRRATEELQSARRQLLLSRPEIATEAGAIQRGNLDRGLELNHIRSVMFPVELPGKKKVLTLQEVYGILRRQGFSGTTTAYAFADGGYQPAEAGWLRDKFGPAARGFASRLGASAYTLGPNDCDDLARLMVVYGQLCHASTPGRHPESALAAGEMWFSRGGVLHALVVAVTASSKGEASLLFIDNDGAEVKLSKKEIESCVYVRF